MPGNRKRCGQNRLTACSLAGNVPVIFGFLATLILLLLPQNGAAQKLDIFPLSEVRAGQRGIGKTVFSGGRIEEFQVEILGILRDSGPKQSIILARLSGGPLGETGVMQGMSGSPVYINGRLVGAVALAFPFSKEPIAGIRPIEEIFTAPLSARADARIFSAGSSRLVDIATPVAFHGFSTSALERFEPELKKLGLDPRQGVSSGASLPPRMGDPSQLHPGDMISVQLLSGDLSAGADGTVTAIEGKRVYAFGHQFLDSGETDLPFARAEVIALLPNLNTSFKISSPSEWMGAITQDRNTAIAGELGRRAATIPLNIRMQTSAGRVSTYHMQMASIAVLTPLLLQMAIFSTIDASERALGPASYDLRGTAAFQRGLPLLRFDNSYAGDLGVPSLVSSAVASSVGYALSLNLPALRLQEVNLDIRASEKRRLLTITRVTPSKREVLPGDSVELYIVLSSTDGPEERKTVKYQVPVGAPAGPLQFSVTDATSANLAEYARFLGTPPRSPEQAIAFLNGLRDNGKAYMRILRADPSFTVGGETLPDPPPSLGLILARDPSSWNTLLGQGSKMEEIAIDLGDGVVSGSQSVQIQVKR